MEYYIVLNGVKEGPFALEELKAKGVTESTLVWKNGLTDWVKANSLPEVMQAIYTAPSAPVPPQPQPIPATPEPQPAPQPAPAPQPQVAPQPQPAPAQQYQQPAQPKPAAAKPQTSQAPTGAAPDDYQQKNLILAVVSFVCCGVIGAIFAILGYIAGSEVKKFWMLGQTEMAERKAADAKKWFKISIIVDCVLGVLGVIYGVVMVLLSTMN